MSKHIDVSFAALRDGYASDWRQMRIRPERLAAVDAAARRILSGRDRYLEVQGLTGVPWWVVGIIHKMECNCRFDQHLHNGDPLTARTRQVPAGRPHEGEPPFAWSHSAADALLYDRLDKITGWSIERFAHAMETYNGFGSRYRSAPSAYLWSFSNRYYRGKFVADGKWDADAISQQTGAMPLLYVLRQMDRGVVVELEADRLSAVTVDEAETLPRVTTPPPPAAPTAIKDLVPVSRKMSVLEDVKLWAGIGGAGSGVATAADTFGFARGLSDGIKAALADHMLLIVFATCVAAAGLAWMLQSWIAQDHAEGRYLPSRRDVE